MKFSIVITVTKPEQSMLALESALSQNYDDYEIIFSNNSGVDLRKNIKKKNSRKIKYFSTPKYLTIVEHWNFAFEKASGRWQLLLCDDDVLIFNKLKYLSDLIEKNKDPDLLMWDYGYYLEENKRKVFSIPDRNFLKPFDIIYSKKILKDLYKSASLSGNVKQITPFLPRAVFSQKMIKKIKKVVGKLFITPDPMTACAVSALHSTKTVVKVNDFLTLINVTPKDNAVNHIKNPKTFKKMHYGVKIKYAPIKSMHNFPSTFLDTLLAIEEKFLKKPDFFVNYKNFFFFSYLQLLECDSNKILQKKLAKQFKSDIKNQSYNVRFFLFLKIIIYKLLKVKFLSFFKDKLRTNKYTMKILNFDENSNINSYNNEFHRK